MYIMVLVERLALQCMYLVYAPASVPLGVGQNINLHICRFPLSFCFSNYGALLRYHPFGF